MKQKTHTIRNNSKIDKHCYNARENGSTDKSTKAYHKLLAKIYAYESDTLYKRDKPQRHIK